MAASLLMFTSPQPMIRAKELDSTPRVSVLRSESSRKVEAMPSHSSAPLAAARRTIDSFAVLGPNWDSYGGDPISAHAISTAHRLLGDVADWGKLLPATFVVPYFVAPLASGGVQIEWRGLDRAIEVVVHSTSDIDYLIEDIESGNVLQEVVHKSPETTLVAVTSVLNPTTGA